MKIAVAHENGQVAQHFGHCAEFLLCTPGADDALTCEVVTLDGTDHEYVAAALWAKDVDVVVCGGIGEGALEALEAQHLLVSAGAEGSAEEAAKSFLRGERELTFSPSCQDEGGCGGSCGSCGGGCGGGCGSCGGGCSGGMEEREPYVETRTFPDIIELTDESFDAEVMNDPGLILIDFWAEWCQPCRMMAPVFAELNGEFPQVKFCKINCDEQPRLAAMFGIDSIPTLALVQGRRTLDGLIGVRPKEEVAELIRRYQR